MSPSVSVVIPHFNSSKTLVRALESIDRQSLPVREVIVVDDASTADELAAAQEAARAFPGVRVIDLARNQGPAHARNVGWDASVGEWIAFLDSDDAWHPAKLELQLAAADVVSERPDLIACITRLVNSMDELSAIEPAPQSARHWVRKKDLLVRNRMSTPSVIVHRDLRERFATGRHFSEDYQLWLTIAGRGHRVLMVDEVLAGIFKPAYGASGLSSQIFRMIAGEYLAYVGARRDHALTRTEMLAGLGMSTVRSMIRLVRLALRRNARTT